MILFLKYSPTYIVLREKMAKKGLTTHPTHTIHQPNTTHTNPKTKRESPLTYNKDQATNRGLSICR